jgi:hypothetical protein
MDDTCPNCGLTYDRFRTGETFASVRAELYVTSNDPADWKHKRRNTVLGRWHQMKQSMWQYHLDTCRNWPELEAGPCEREEY